MRNICAYTESVADVRDRHVAVAVHEESAPGDSPTSGSSPRLTKIRMASSAASCCPHRDHFTRPLSICIMD